MTRLDHMAFMPFWAEDVGSSIRGGPVGDVAGLVGDVPGLAVGETSEVDDGAGVIL
eukprot:CAMPEP_0202494448 /NCGR_PEP_ID=MMETSP1361-20130828/11789_1 /ASSEMBLY_ACC=CAM_ASM_000849 /TAXON_ID=210615 /ORGANISM="Staurosira complex sp., Strain CCMP2646" /LENGTH=55 /DNA_ID=CAMNT_0049124961 /DNA_START=127 /DNA_END=290 /DNA_ORIENTATION=-